MIKLVSVVLFGAMMALFGLGFYKWDYAKNRGYSSGYWGEFNRTSNALAAIPGVKITQKWYNKDLTLEEFGFNVQIDGHPVNLAFGESDPIRSMSREKATGSLTAIIRKEENNLKSQPVTP